ncbi:cyclic di-GMP phosphodiesterase [Erwiniaceae bacterium BAC15a-03b]|uniref:cyclic-guanylate-specific phosphodiesterase n=1 Tax=Winslowiella arboricola TaxID=2978220 RepID=A0A9J6PXL0_9GAMM|nr:cyclic di-GMP phosphodiesterase [Winslowiella arboricola]MCU5773160.1 cyclic di-GMP phosphodiesterase [Winslowiella arboricola]MCU5778743.1 cyclic di-GMP phosphodiesterase [Winslowiella arboricola]
MPLSTLVKHPLTNARKIAWVSVAVGLIFFLFFTAITMSIAWHKRARGNDQLLLYTQNFILKGFGNLRTSLDPLRTLTMSECSQVNNQLTSRAAFINEVRAILLVRNGIAYCSSATGAFSLPVSAISAQSDLNKDFDLTMIAGTPMLPKQPAIVMWVKQPGSDRSGVLTTLNLNMTPYLLLASRQLEISGMALANKENAVTTWSEAMIHTSQLPASPLRMTNVPGYPLSFYLYGNNLPQRDIHIILLTALLLAVLVTSGCFLILTLQVRPGKEIMQAIKRGEFHVEYQPLVEAASGKAYGLEALLRWVHPVAGNIPPDLFISYAEGQNLIIPLTRHLFELVARDAHKIRQVIPVGTKMGVNLSPLHLSSDSFRDDVNSWIRAMPEKHFGYIFEITERTMVSGGNTSEVFDWLHDQGYKIAIDDFGTGHSALIYLEKFKFDYLKIDRGFVQSIGMETVTSPVLDAVLNLAKKLNLSTVAEGVETEEQAVWLVNRGVSHMQGYFFARPMNVSQLIAWFQTRQPA